VSGGKEDLMRRTEYFANARDPGTLTVPQLMEDVVVTVAPQTNARAVAELLTDGNFGSVPVVEGDWTLVGLVSEFDLLRAMDQAQDIRALSAADVMTRDVVTVTEDMPVKDLIHLLQERHLIRVPVVRGKKLVGVVARRDIVFGYVKATAKYWP
jgi:CBS domain-containing protein